MQVVSAITGTQTDRFQEAVARPWLERHIQSAIHFLEPIGAKFELEWAKALLNDLT
jgi:hypothetical protein